MNKSARSFNIVILTASLMFSGWLYAADLVLRPRIEVSAPRAELTQDAQSWLREHKIIRVGVWGSSHPPVGEGMSYGIYQGIAADYLAMLESSLQVNFELYYYPTSNDALNALSRNEIDMVSVWNPARWPSQAAVSSIPWLLDKSVIIAPEREASPLSSGTDFTLGVVPDGYDLHSLREHYSAGKIRFISSFDQALNDVTFGQIDALWLNRATADYLIRYQHTRDLIITPSSALPDLNLSFGVNRELPELQSAIDSTLQQLPLVSRMRIATGWGLDREAVVTRNPLGLTVDEERWLHTYKRIPVILDSQRPPLSYLDNGKPAGLVVDMLDALTKRYGLAFDLLIADERTVVKKLHEAHPQALLTNAWLMPWSDRSKNSSALRSTLISSPMVIVMQQSVTIPESMDNLKGERLAINRDNPVVPWLQKWYPSVELTLTDNLDQAAALLRSNSVRGFIAPQLVARYFIRAGEEENWHIGISIPLPAAHLVINASESPSIPLQIVEKALADVPPENVIELMAPWQQLQTSLVPGVSDKQLGFTLILGSALAALLLVSTLWIRRLYSALQNGKQAQNALRDQYNFIRALIDNAPVALYARDRQGRLLDFNQRWSDTVRMDGSELQGSLINDIVSMEPEATDQLSAQYQRALKNGEALQWSGPFLFDNERHYLQGWTVPWRDSSGKIGGLIGGWLDVTEKESLIGHLQMAKKELEQANASKAAFMQTMGHEVRTPLNAIIGLLEIELQKKPVSEYSGENLALIWESAGNLLSLIGDVFDVFRADDLSLRGMIRSVHLPQLIESTVALYRQQLTDKGLTMETETALKTYRFDTDALLIIRIFSSLLRNAIKHSQGGMISVAIYQGREDEREMVPLVIEVSNEGFIAENITPLTQAIPCGSGWQETGISLSACQIMATASGAELAIESDAHAGTTVSFYFKAKPSDENRPLPRQQDARVLHILIADDYAPGRRALQQQLESWGHVILQAANGEQALEIWRQQISTIDLIITDCTMPVMDGFSLASRIREEEKLLTRASKPIFGLTAMTGFEITTRCIAAGMNECLIKPLSPEALQIVLQRYFPELSPASSASDSVITDDAGFLREVAEVNHQDAEQLRVMLQYEDIISVGRLAHRLKGAATLLKDSQFHRACELLESACEHQTSFQEIQCLAEDVFLSLENANSKIYKKMHPDTKI